MGIVAVNSGGIQPTELVSAVKALQAAHDAQVTAGSGTGVFGGEGNLSAQVSIAGVGNTADTTDDVLFTYTLPANSFDQAGRAVTVTAFGKFAANANSKRVKIWFGATVVADTGAQTTAANGVGWQLQADIAKVGAANANTQVGQGQAIYGATHGGVNVPVTPTETENAGIVIKVTGSSASSAASDVLGQFFQVNFQD